MPRELGAVIVAAGRGERAGADRPKQLQPLGGVPVLLRAIRPFASHPEIARVVVVLPPALAERPPEWLAPHLGDRLTVTAGGERRMDSVERGLAALPAAVEGVLVHDGARPFPDAGVIDAVIAEVKAGRAAIAARPVTDTLKEADAAGADGARSVVRTVPRERLWRAQTPQGFPRRDLEAGICRARERGESPTDDAALLEALGIAVRLIPDVARNLKLTTPDDFAVARALLAEPG